MRNTLLAVLLVFTVSSCTSQDAARRAAAIELGNLELKDPDSAKWNCAWTTNRSASQEERYVADGPILECEVMAKNGFGGYGDGVSFDFIFFDKSEKILSAFYFGGGKWNKIQ